MLPQVTGLQGKLTALVREKTDVQSLKAQIEEQYNILTAQLKAKVETALYLTLPTIF